MNKLQLRKKRARRVRAKIKGTKDCPRFCVFRSLKNIYAQIIDDEAGKVLVSFDSRKMPSLASLASGGKKEKNGVEAAMKVGEEIAKIAKTKKIERVIFDRHGYKYHGNVKALAEGARKGGLKF